MNYGGNATQPANPTRTGYTFAGWFKEAGCTNAWVFAVDIVTANVILYALWYNKTAPLPGNSGTIITESVTHNSLVLNWTAGTDNVTAQSDLQYAVYQSTSNTLTTVSGCESATLIQDYSANLLTKNVTGLSASTTYYFNIVVKDTAGNNACYSLKQQATTAAPVLPTVTTAGITNITGTTATGAAFPSLTQLQSQKQPCGLLRNPADNLISQNRALCRFYLSL